MRKNEVPSNEPKQCFLCTNGLTDIDYKEANLLRKFISSYGKIAPKRRSHLCSKHQRKVSLSIKRARIMALLPFCNK